MAEKRVIEQNATSAVHNDSWFLTDSPTEGTEKISGSNLKTYMNEGQATSDDLADAYNSNLNYVEGDVCIHDDTLYKANASTTGTWDITKWDAVTVADLIEEGGKVKDVKVNGTSVVDEDKTANVSVPVLDVTVNGGSVVNNSKVAVLDALATYGEASGAIATFSDGSDLPVKELKVTIEPVQSGSGDTSPTNKRPIIGWTGANIVNMDDVTNQEYFKGVLLGTYGALQDISTLTWYYNAESDFFYSNEVTNCEAILTGYPNAILNLNYTKVAANGLSSTDQAWTVYRGRIYIKDSAKTEEQLRALIVGKQFVFKYITPTTPTITPTQFNALLSAFEINGNDVSVSWQTEAGTVYGAELDVTTGLLVVKSHGANLPDLNWNSNATNIFYAEISDIYNRQSGEENDALCSCYASENVWKADDLSDKHFMIRGDIKRIYIRDTDYTSAQAFKTAVAGQKLVYELATPIEVQLTPTQVNTILGENNLFADSGDINKVVYVRDNSLIIDNILSRLEALEG